MTSPAVFSLLRSELNAFLSAPIGEEANGMTLSVISALARLDQDPWEEAAKLSRLKEGPARAAVGRLVGQIQGGLWTPADVVGIAARLVDLLPDRDSHVAAQQTNMAKNESTKPESLLRGLLQPLEGRFRTVVLAVCFALGTLALYATMTNGSDGPGDGLPPITSATGMSVPQTE